MVEGEKTARAVQRAGFTAASYLGGSGSVELADYSILSDKIAVIWPDNDGPGRQAAGKAAKKADDAGADVVWILDPVEGDKGDAADIPEEELAEFISDRLCTATVYDNPNAQPQAFRLVWRDMADVLDLPPVNWILPGVLAEASMCMLTGATKAGKTLFVLALLKAATTGLPFLGYKIPTMRGWYLTEMTDYVLKAQLGIINWMPPRDVFPTAYKNEQDFSQMTPRALADGLLWDYDAALTAGRPPKIIVIDTLGRWLRGFDFNDYTQVTAATEPLLMAASELKRDGCMFLLLHHQRKGGGRGTDGSLGSQALSGSVDTHCGLTLKSVDSEIRALSIQSRLGLGDLGGYVEIELALPTEEYRLVARESEDLEAAVVEYLTDHPDGASPKAIREALEIEDRFQMARACTALVESGVLTSTGKARSTRYFMADRTVQLPQDFVSEN